MSSWNGTPRVYGVLAMGCSVDLLPHNFEVLGFSRSNRSNSEYLPRSTTMIPPELRERAVRKLTQAVCRSPPSHCHAECRAGWLFRC